MSCDHTPGACACPVAVLKADRKVTVDALADHLRREFQKSVGVTGALPWSVLSDSERRRWTLEAERDIASREDTA